MITEKQSHPDSESTNVGFVVGEYDGLLSPEELQTLDEWRVEAEREGGTIGPEYVAIQGTQFAVDKLKKGLAETELGQELDEEGNIQKHTKEVHEETERELATTREVTRKLIESEPKSPQDQPDKRRPKAGKNKDGNKYRRKNSNNSVLSVGSKSRKQAKQEELADSAWPRFEAGNLSLNPEEAVLEDGRHKLFFVGAEGRDMLHPENNPRIVYELKGNNRTAVLLGLMVPEQMRGRGLGEKMITYFLDGIEQQGKRFGGTNRIHKPGIALLLKKMGFEPMRDDIRAQVLPQEPGDDPDTPKIVFVAKGNRLQDMVTGSTKHDFYQRVLASEVPGGFKPDPDKIVSLHTPYSLPRQKRH